ncbi:similar to Saccharomyces cerevisiae YIL145C PAN6 Pantothenate synthase [Maudiozyma saulgeensis]|uniref:Pantoate--beta-alanine ligase n=1 Tax=Maudiozyma saulgeensis TaxID=1789683 RepID=A0A1X7QWV6_9SACH|nr:similar to Saccharomyces cerevisiae YIL145C PAN6 Pantothenate synthase [Kazachstania saulgeensis]
MKILHTIQEVVQWRTTTIDRRGKTIGFVPTMGCLHNGHATLIKQSVDNNDFTVVSIFVNPSQFAPNEDLDQYPRTPEEDIKLLESLNVDVLFAPSANEMYPQGIPLDVEQQRGPFVSVLGVSEMLEGKTRPNFFRGVTTVVTKLFNIVMADNAYFGQKDIQQFIVLNVMVKELFVNTKLTMVPIVRNNAGLALSSRNKYLSPEYVTMASNIYKGLSLAQTTIATTVAKGLSVERDILLQEIKTAWEPYTKTADFKIDYISIADFYTLHEMDIVGPSDKIVISCAVNVFDKISNNTVRLIDNIVM